MGLRASLVQHAVTGSGEAGGVYHEALWGGGDPESESDKKKIHGSLDFMRERKK